MTILLSILQNSWTEYCIEKYLLVQNENVPLFFLTYTCFELCIVSNIYQHSMGQFQYNIKDQEC